MRLKGFRQQRREPSHHVYLAHPAIGWIVVCSLGARTASRSAAGEIPFLIPNHEPVTSGKSIFELLSIFCQYAKVDFFIS